VSYIGLAKDRGGHLVNQPCLDGWKVITVTVHNNKKMKTQTKICTQTIQNGVTKKCII